MNQITQQNLRENYGNIEFRSITPEIYNLLKPPARELSVPDIYSMLKNNAEYTAAPTKWITKAALKRVLRTMTEGSVIFVKTERTEYAIIRRSEQSFRIYTQKSGLIPMGSITYDRYQILLKRRAKERYPDVPSNFARQDLRGGAAAGGRARQTYPNIPSKFARQDLRARQPYPDIPSNFTRQDLRKGPRERQQQKYAWQNKGAAATQQQDKEKDHPEVLDLKARLGQKRTAEFRKEYNQIMEAWAAGQTSKWKALQPRFLQKYMDAAGSFRYYKIYELKERVQEAPLTQQQRQFYLNTLGLSAGATPSEIRKAYLKLSLRYHPDKATANQQMFKQVAQAYTALSK